MRRTPWAWWVARVNRPVDVRPFALARISLALCVLVDQLQMWSVGMSGVAYQLSEYGGLGGFHRAQYWFLDAGPAAAPALWVVWMVCMACVALGVATRPAMLFGVLAYAQLGHLFPTGDRGVDRIVRTVLLLLLFTNAHRCYALGNVLRRRPRLATTPGWAHDLVHLFLVVVYAAAGVAKVANNGWWKLSGTPMLLRVLADPMAGRIDPDTRVWRSSAPLLRVAGMATVVWEVMSPMFLTRYARWWALFGVAMHLGIAATMKLGMFSYGMLSLYWIVLAPVLLPAIDRVEARLGWWAVPPVPARAPGPG